MNASRITLVGLVVGCLVGACGGRPAYWDKPVSTANVTYGLAGGVAVVDDADHRVVVFTGTADQKLTPHSFRIGHNFASAATSADRSTLFVLSAGDWPVKTQSDELPSLTVITQGDPTKDATLVPSAKAYTMSEPVSNLAIDPFGACGTGACPPSYAVAYQGSTNNTSFAQNQNEIVIFDLTKGYVPEPGSAAAPPNPVSRNIRSFGGTPQRLTFSPSLMLPANISAAQAMAGVKASARRLLLIESTLDVTIVDLSHAFDAPTPPATTTFGRPEITVRLTSGTSTTSVAPAGLVIDPNPNDGRIAFRTASDTNVYTLQLLPSPGLPNDFNPQINVTDVGGTPTAIQFVHADQGALRLAALVPSKMSAVLVEPDTELTTPVALAAGYTNMSIVADTASGPSTTTLLWSQNPGAASGVALWTLGMTVGQPYRAIEVLDIADPIQAVFDVPGSSRLKVLATQNSGDFYVLDLVQQTANPIHTTSTSPLLMIAPDGGRVWAYDQGTDLAAIDFTTLNPVPLTTGAPISVVYDVANPTAAGGGRSLIAIHAEGTLGATVFNALSPEATTGGTTSRRDVALLLSEGL
jgi:hypothetical protein